MRPPHYTGKKPLGKRTDVLDKRALKLAKKALLILRDEREKPNATRSDNTTNADVEENSAILQGSAQQKREVLSQEEQPIQGPNTNIEWGSSQSGAETEQPFFYGDNPDVMLPMRSMYDGTGDWPKRRSAGPGSKQYSWSNIGFPKDKTLKIKEFEDDTIIDQDMPTVITLADTVRKIKTRNAEEIADGGKIQRSAHHNRMVEDFTMNGWTITKVKFSDVVISASYHGSTYQRCQTAADFEEKITKAIGKQPQLLVEQWAAAHVLLAKGGDIGGRTADYWRRARHLAQQQLYVNPELEPEIQRHIHDRDFQKDTAFVSMFEIVQEALKARTENPYFQSQRDAYAVENGIFHHITAEITMVLDRNDDVIAFQCADAFKKLLDGGVQKNVTEAFETFSTMQAVPLPDMTRHGLHYIDWLAERPEFDFRNPENNPRLAKSGVYHIGARCATGDPTGQEGLYLTKDCMSRMQGEDSLHIPVELHRLRYNALGACTELLTFFFGILDPKLLGEYWKVAAEISKLKYLPFETRQTDEAFAMRALLVNLMTYDHKDSSDWRHGFAGLVSVGSFEGGDLLLRQLGLRVANSPGAVQLIRGRELRHSITKWKGRRFVSVHVTHEAVRRWAFRQRGEALPSQQPSGSTTADNCDVRQEDILPEDQTVTTDERELFPERWVPHVEGGGSSEDGDESDSSEPEILVAPRHRKTKAKSNNSSDASGEQSGNDVGGAGVRPKRQKKQT